MRFIETIYHKLRRHPKRIVFPEGEEPRVLRAAYRFAKLQLGIPILLGNKEQIQKLAAAENLDLDHVAIVNPETSSDLQVFCERLEQLERYRRMGIMDSKKIMLNPNYFAAMMLQYGQADGLVGGASVYSSTLLRPLLQLVKPLPNVKSISSAMVVELPDKKFGENGVYFFADCGVIPEPNVDQLASIAVETGKLCRQLTGVRPRVAMLSFSTKGSAKTSSTEKVIAATALAKQKAEADQLELEIDGEMQVDTAIDPIIAERKATGSMVAGKANVMVFPDLNSANIGSKLVQYFGNAETYGQILLGLSKPAGEVSRGSNDDDILGVAAIVGLQAIAYRKLYPDGEGASINPAGPA